MTKIHLQPKPEASPVNGTVKIMQERIAELERERSLCETCRHVYLFANLNVPCPHCIIEKQTERIAELEGKLSDSLKNQAIEQRSGFWGRAAARYLNQRDDLRAQLTKAQEAYSDLMNVTDIKLAEAQQERNSVRRRHIDLRRAVDALLMDGSNASPSTWGALEHAYEVVDDALEAEVTRLRDENEQIIGNALRIITTGCERHTTPPPDWDACAEVARCPWCKDEENTRLRQERDDAVAEYTEYINGGNPVVSRLRAAIQTEIRELTAIAVSLERGGGDAWRTREKLKGWEEVLGDG